LRPRFSTSAILPLAEAPHAYQIFRDKEDNCVKVMLKP
jgi:threonine dehydrogenase-like Zn-dependent dehydrogenase